MPTLMLILDTLVYYCGDVIAFGYPGLKTFEAAQKADTGSEAVDLKWLTYWVVFSLFYVVEYFLYPVLDLVLFGQYHYVRFAILVFFSANDGTQKLYNDVLMPQLRTFLPDLFAKVAPGVGAGARKFD
eukprot:TRINITY_DN16422_c0_g1_i1.p2 TRINITY_DN16422_c0_g1~~TRINITY_DN16422_c0_g1_i1.p2  ORF type:complete len:128 (+),score=63.60 TRINITY_DN16422_c0_g1_i1:75-458(+)